jgi:molybdate transport system ATP-binding protein
MTSSQNIQARFAIRLTNNGKQAFSLNVDLEFPGSGVTAIFGPSGSGKTTLLRCMAGLQNTSGGYFNLSGTVWQDGDRFVPVHKRELGFVFQEASLFEHLSVEANLNYARKRAGKKKGNDSQTAMIDYQQVIALLGIGHLLANSPGTLSGGERQRVAIARALLRQPRIVFMDEPLAALDFRRKQEILPYLDNLSQSLSIPIVYVSHAIEEVARLADYLIMMDAGSVVTQGVLQDVLSRVDLPVQLDNDLGAVFDAEVSERDHHWHLMRVRFAGGSLWLKDTGHALGHCLRVRILARDVSLACSRQDSSILNNLPADVSSIVEDRDPAMALVSLKVGEISLIARLTRRSAAHLGLKPGQKVRAQIKSVAILP